MALQGPGDTSAGLHRFDKLRQRGGRCRPAAQRQAHGLLDDHEAAGQQAVAGVLREVGLQLLTHAGGHLQAMRHTVRHHGRRARGAHQRGLLVVLDAKRNDIGTTAEAYAAAYLGRRSPWGADCLTVSPYLGDDSLDPFVEACRRSAAGIFVLVKTSNPGGGFLQDRVCDGEKLYQTVANWITQKNESLLGVWGYGPIGAVVGATYPEELSVVRTIVGDMPLLVPGVGAQGGDVEATVRAGRDSSGYGMMINSSRAIIYASSGTDYAEAAQRAAADLRDQIRAVI